MRRSGAIRCETSLAAHYLACTASTGGALHESACDSKNSFARQYQRTPRGNRNTTAGYSPSIGCSSLAAAKKEYLTLVSGPNIGDQRLSPIHAVPSSNSFY